MCTFYYSQKLALLYNLIADLDCLKILFYVYKISFLSSIFLIFN